MCDVAYSAYYLASHWVGQGLLQVHKTSYLCLAHERSRLYRLDGHKCAAFLFFIYMYFKICSISTKIFILMTTLEDLNTKTRPKAPGFPFTF